MPHLISLTCKKALNLKPEEINCCFSNFSSGSLTSLNVAECFIEDQALISILSKNR